MRIIAAAADAGAAALTGIAALVVGAGALWRLFRVEGPSATAAELAAERAENRQLRAELTALEARAGAAERREIDLEAKLANLRTDLDSAVAQIDQLRTDVGYWRRRFDEVKGL